MWMPTSTGTNSALNPFLTFPVTLTGMSSVGPEIKINIKIKMSLTFIFILASLFPEMYSILLDLSWA